MDADKRDFVSFGTCAPIDEGHRLGMLVLAFVGACLEHHFCAIEFDRQHRVRRTIGVEFRLDAAERHLALHRH
jgi:hypothetical protein